MAMTAEDYQAQMEKLLPPGHAWQRGSNPNLIHLLRGIGAQLARLDVSAAQLHQECVPETAIMLLEDWENALGLPECGLSGDNLQKRQLDAYAKETADGGLSSWYYEALALRAGFEVDVDDAYGHHCESLCDASLYHELSGLAPIVYSKASARHWTSCNEACTTPVRRYGDGRLECLLNAYKPAHVRFIYGFTEPGETHASSR